MIYIGVSYGVKRRKHLNVDSFAMLFQKKGKAVIGIISNSLFLIFALIMTYFSFNIMAEITRESAALQIPMEWVYAAPAVGMMLTVFRLIQVLLLQIKELKTPGIDNNPDN